MCRISDSLSETNTYVQLLSAFNYIIDFLLMNRQRINSEQANSQLLSTTHMLLLLYK